MSTAPEVSVVMGVRNGAEHLSETVDSVLTQEGVDLEFIVVDDGSTDSTCDVLAEWARGDRRVRVVHQPQGGLTRALVRGCAQARGRLIARQDCGDRSLPGRLQSEVALLRSQPEAALASCGTRFMGPDGDVLYEVTLTAEEAEQGLADLDLRRIKAPPHGGTMFRRLVYEQAGGYRTPFYVAQDLDLWLRMVEYGHHAALRDVLYEARWSPNSITGLHRRAQVKATKLILEATVRRRQGLGDEAILAMAEGLGRDRWSRWTNLPRRADAWYFMGACLRARNPARARQYFRQALRCNPLHLKSWVRLFAT